MSSESQNDPELDELIAKWLELVESGVNPDPAEFIKRWPHRAVAFEAYLDNERQLEALKAAAGAESTFIATAPKLDARASDMIGGRYKLLELIDKGGMGAVWLAEQREPVRRKVAIKLIKPGMDSQEILVRFEAERQALALMEHENIAKVFDGGMTDTGRPYFAMEYVNGEPITDYCDRHHLSLEARLSLFISVCRAVQHAHQKGIVHRDLKPSNVLVCPFDGRPVPKVIDFGLAKAMNQPLTEKTLFTGHGILVGTPRYMSPEQAENNNLDVDTRTDVYSLGVLLYELLTGSTPLTSEQLHQVALHEIVRLIKDEEPVRPSTRLSSSDALPNIAAHRSIEPGRLARSLAGDLDWIALKALAKERERRYGSPSDLAKDVERFLANDVVEARPPSRVYQLRKFARRHRGKVGAFMAVILSLIAGIVASTLFAIETLRARTAEADSNARYVEQLQQTSEQERRALEKEAEARVAKAGEATSRFYQFTEIAQREINSHRAGWKSRASAAISSARNVAGLVEDGDYRLRSLIAATNVRLDVSEPLFKFKQRGLKSLAFHPSKDWLFVATGRAYLPDPRCHIFVLNATTGDVIHDIGLMNAIYPASNGIEWLLISGDGRWLFAATTTTTESSTVLVFDTTALSRSTEPVRKFEIPIRKLMNWMFCDSANVIVMSGREQGNAEVKFGDFKMVSVNAATGEITAETKISAMDTLITTIAEDSFLICSAPNTFETRDAITHSVRRSQLRPAGFHWSAFDESTVAIADAEFVHLYSLDRSSWSFARAETPPDGLPNENVRGRLLFSPNGQLLVMGDAANKRVHSWSGSDFQYGIEFGVSGSDSSLHLEFSSDGSLLAATQGETASVLRILPSRIKIHGLSSAQLIDGDFDHTTGRLVLLRPNTIPSGTLDFWMPSSDSAFVSSQELRPIPVLPLTQGGARSLVAQHKDQCAVLSSAAPDGSPYEATVSVYDGKHWNGLISVSKPDLIDFRPNGELICVSDHGTVLGLSAETGEVRRQLRRIENLLTGGSSYFTTTTHVDELLILTDDNGYCTILDWSAVPPQHVNTLRISEAPIRAAAYIPERDVLISGDDDGTISIIDYRNSQVLCRHEGAHSGPIHAIACIDSKLTVTGGYDRRVVFWEHSKAILSPYFEFSTATPVQKLFAAPRRNSVIMLRERCVAFEEIPVNDLLTLDASM
ncbi:MAG: WD40 repeat domain-containing serine/threonine protein kinase [Planctomycetaceae bacterium]